jgi:hypothetical protein
MALWALTAAQNRIHATGTSGAWLILWRLSPAETHIFLVIARSFSDEAIQLSAHDFLDCFASLAMTFSIRFIQIIPTTAPG